jgi:transcriptional regulator with XRE-family HTH domain
MQPKADLHRTYISEVERGTQNLTIETLSRLADALETSGFV